jgi:hypothetical protein
MSAPAIDPASLPKSYPARRAGWHLQCCDDYGVTVTRERAKADGVAGWWRAAAHDAEGRVLYATGGRTRRHAETNALDGAGAPMKNPKPDGMDWLSDGPP